jgi:hypothetical protein
MTAAEARHFLETCNEQIEAGMTDELARQILAANEIVASAPRETRAELLTRIAGQTPATQSAAFRVRPHVHPLLDGTFQPNVLFDDGGLGNIVCGDPVATLHDASEAAIGACEAALPAGGWRDDGWYALDCAEAA